MFYTHRQELYLFTYNDERVALTSSNRNYTFENIEYIADKFITRTKISNISQESSAPETQITVSKDNPVTEWFKYSAPFRVVELQIISIDINNPENFNYIWAGTVMQATLKENKTVFDCYSKEQLLDSEMNRMRYQNKCNYTLGREGCGLDINNFSFTTTITNIGADGITFDLASVDNREDNWFKNGTMKFGNQLSMITTQTGSQITTLQMYVDIKVGDQVIITWGCDRLPDTCKNKFNNLVNNGAFPFVPSRNPFSGEMTS